MNKTIQIKHILPYSFFPCNFFFRTTYSCILYDITCDSPTGGVLYLKVEMQIKAKGKQKDSKGRSKFIDVLVVLKKQGMKICKPRLVLV